MKQICCICLCDTTGKNRFYPHDRGNVFICEECFMYLAEKTKEGNVWKCRINDCDNSGNTSIFGMSPGKMVCKEHAEIIKQALN
jgi:hypothetical protein